MDTLLEEIATKLQLLEFKRNKAKDIVEKGNTATIERHREALVALAKEVDRSQGEDRRKETGRRWADGWGMCTWSNEIDAKIEGVDAEIEYLGRLLREKRQQSELAEKEGEEALLEKEREKQLKFEKEKLEMKLKYEDKCAELRKWEPRGVECGFATQSCQSYQLLNTMGNMNNGFHFGINSARKPSQQI